MLIEMVHSFQQQEKLKKVKEYIYIFHTNSINKKSFYTIIK